MTYNPMERSTESTQAEEDKKRFESTRDSVSDDFEAKSDYWHYRHDGVSEIVVSDSVIRLVMGPTEALYYSNAEISDGDFNHLPWEACNIEFKVRLLGNHFGSAGWGFWNYSMVVDESVPIWFIYLRSKSPKYPLNGFYVQVDNVFTPIKYFNKPPISLRIATRLVRGLIPVKFTTIKPVIPDLELSEWHIYKMLRENDYLLFYIDDREVSRVRIPRSKYRYRADAWIDNAVFTPLKGDYARVYRHVTHENRDRAVLEIDYIKIWRQ